MNETEYLLAVVAEESGEIGQRACKAIRFGLTEIQPGQQEDNQRRLEREIADLMGTARMLGLTIREEDILAKIEKVKKYMEYSEEVGTLEVEQSGICGASSGGGIGCDKRPGHRGLHANSLCSITWGS
jgi:hypothetical protein